MEKTGGPVSADLFDQYASMHFGGGRLDTAKLRPSTAAYIADARATAEQWIAVMRASHPRLPPIHFDFISSADDDAWAFTYKNQYFIGITAGMAFGIRALFERMLSDKRILIEIGNPSNENEHPPLSQPLLRTLLEENGKYGPTPIRDQIRYEYCNQLCFLALSFLVFHELSHIKNGHVDYWAARGIPFLAEFSWVPRTVDESIMRQSLEYDADTGATGFLVDLVKQWFDKQSFNIEPLRTYDGILCSVMVAIFSFFRLYEDDSIAGADLYKSSHPSFRIRIGCVQRTALGVIQGRHGLPQGPNSTFPIRHAQYLAEQAFHFITGEPMPTEEGRYIESWLPAGVEYRERLKQCWEIALRKELETYAYGAPMIMT